MRTISAKHAKGQEPPRTLGDTLRLLCRIAAMGFAYLVKGRKIRREFYRRQRAGEKMYIDEIDYR
jgi:hypothetical protein